MLLLLPPFPTDCCSIVRCAVGENSRFIFSCAESFSQLPTRCKSERASERTSDDFLALELRCGRRTNLDIFVLCSVTTPVCESPISGNGAVSTRRSEQNQTSADLFRCASRLGPLSPFVPRLVPLAGFSVHTPLCALGSPCHKANTLHGSRVVIVSSFNEPSDQLFFSSAKALSSR